MSDPWDAQREVLGAFIRSQRKLANLSLRQLAEMTSLSNPYLSQIERGLHQPSVRVLKAISDALDLSAETVMAHAGLGTGQAGPAGPGRPGHRSGDQRRPAAHPGPAGRPDRGLPQHAAGQPQPPGRLPALTDGRRPGASVGQAVDHGGARRRQRARPSITVAPGSRPSRLPGSASLDRRTPLPTTTRAAATTRPSTSTRQPPGRPIGVIPPYSIPVARPPPPSPRTTPSGRRVRAGPPRSRPPGWWRAPRTRRNAAPRPGGR